MGLSETWRRWRIWNLERRLIYASTFPCRCGGRLAYDRRRGDHLWRCEHVLRDQAPEDQHDSMPFLVRRFRPARR